MHKGNYNNVIDALVAKSDFLEDFPDLIAKARVGMAMTIDRHLVANKEDLYLEEDKFQEGKYTSIVFNCQFKETRSGKELFTAELIEPEEHLITCDEDFRSLQIGNIPQCAGVGMIAIAEQVRQVYEEIVESRGQDIAISDFRSDLIHESLGGLSRINFIQKPMDARVSEVQPVVLHRKLINGILDSLILPGERILVLGGDGGSASKRRRGYFIDCIYFSEKKRRTAAKDRRNFGTMGEDYFIEDLKMFNWELARTRYKVVMFNYLGDSLIADILSQQFSQTDVLVMGIVCDPLLTHDTDIADFGDDVEAFNLYWKAYEVPEQYDYKVIAVTNEMVAVYVDHGKFADARWKYREDYYSINRTAMVQMMNIPCEFKGMEHGAIKILKNRNRYIQTLNYQIPCQTEEEYEKRKRIFRIHDKRLYDLEGIMVHPWIDLPNCLALVLYDENRGLYDFLDINIKGDYWYRRNVMSRSVDLACGYGLMFSPLRRFDDGPNTWLESMRQIALSDDVYHLGVFKYDVNTKGEIDVSSPIMKWPKLQIRGLYYNNMTHKWYYDEEVLAHFFPVDTVMAYDEGQDMEVMIGEYTLNFEMEFEEWNLIPITPTMAFRKVVDGTVRLAGRNYVRLYNYQRIKYPLGEYCAGWTDQRYKTQLETECLHYPVTQDYDDIGVGLGPVDKMAIDDHVFNSFI